MHIPTATWSLWDQVALDTCKINRINSKQFIDNKVNRSVKCYDGQSYIYIYVNPKCS